LLGHILHGEKGSEVERDDFALTEAKNRPHSNRTSSEEKTDLNRLEFLCGKADTRARSM
jgi:hypothetical protein